MFRWHSLFHWCNLFCSMAIPQHNLFRSITYSAVISCSASIICSASITCSAVISCSAVITCSAGIKRAPLLLQGDLAGITKRVLSLLKGSLYKEKFFSFPKKFFFKAQFFFLRPKKDFFSKKIFLYFPKELFQSGRLFTFKKRLLFK